MELFTFVDYFTRLWDERANAPPKGDLISILAHGEVTRNMDRMEYLGNLLLLIIGGVADGGARSDLERVAHR
jgi:cytochrome P450